jgi:hypothetical protein
MVGVLVLALLVTSLYRFVEGMLSAIRDSTEITAERQQLEGLVNFIQVELENLPSPAQVLPNANPQTPPDASGQPQPGLQPAAPNAAPGQPLPDLREYRGSLRGESHKYSGVRNDAMDWVSKGGGGLLTSAVSGDYRVTLTIRNIREGSTETEIGIWRESGDGKVKDWVPLLTPAAELEINYFDPNFPEKPLTAWPYNNRLPSLVYLRIRKTADGAPYDAVLPVPGATLQGGGR